MSIRSDYEAIRAVKEEMEQNRVMRYFMNQEDRWVEPYRMFGDIWYVGDSWVCVHLIDTGDGLLLIDSGNIGAAAMLIDAIWKTGHNPADVKWIVHSHGHVDHIGASNYFKRRYGTKLYLGEGDAKMYREHPELAYVQDSHDPNEDIFVPDYEIKDGEIIRFGNIDMQFYACPGHTDGVISLFFDMAEKGVTYRCGYFGGFGFNTMAKDYLIEIGDPEYKTRQVFLDSLAKVRDQKVDVFLGNHCINNNMFAKREKQLADPEGPNPYIQPGEWQAYLDEKRDAMLAFMADPKNN